MNLAASQQELYRRLKFSTTPDPAVTTRLTAYLNEAQREVLSKKGYGLLRRNVLTFQCVANTPFCVLPQAVEAIVTIQDRVNQWVLQERLIQDIRSEDPGLTDTSAFPDEYAVLNYAAAVAQDPTVASQVWIVSDSAADGGTKTVFIEGLVTGGYYQTASVALNGVTPVQIGALATWMEITKFYIGLTAGGSTTAAGNIKLLQTSGAGTEMGRIPPGLDYARYTRLHLHSTPTQINTYYADVELTINDMANAGDESYLPPDFHWLLISMALMKDYQYRNQTTPYEMELARSTNGLGDLRLWLARRSSVALGDNRRRGRSQLGPNFPADGGFYG